MTKQAATAIRACLWSAAWMLCALSARASAQDQFVIADATFTATAQNTMQSQYPIAPLPAAPANWKSPVDFSSGTMYVRYEVLEKPSNASTYGNICFEQGKTLTCQGYPAPYTTTGVTMNNAKLPTFWQYSMIDWTKKIDRVYVVLKDGSMNIVQGNAMFYPTKLHVTVTVVAPGKTYVMPPPTSDDTDAGTPTTRPMRDAGVTPTAGGAAMMTTPKAGTAAPPATTAPIGTTAGRGAVGTAGRGTAGNSSQRADAGTSLSAADYLDHGSSCSLVSPPRAARAWPALLLLSFVFFARSLSRRRRH